MSARAARIGAATGEAANLVKRYIEAKEKVKGADQKTYPELARILRRRRDVDGASSSVAPNLNDILRRIDEILDKLNTVFAFAKEDGIMHTILPYAKNKLEHYKILVANVENFFDKTGPVSGATRVRFA